MSIIVILILSAVFAKGANDPMPPEPKEKTKTKIVAGGKTVRLQIADLEQMRQSLRDYFATRRADLEKAAPPETLAGIEQTAGEIHIDDDGKARIGLWRLSGRVTGVVLTYRPSADAPYQLEAHMTHESSAWKVAEITFAQFLMRR
jgi:hypothetical protein